jgi:hypothetical protein
MPQLANYHRHPCMRKQGVDGPDIEMFGAQSSPCFLNKLEL